MLVKVKCYPNSKKQEIVKKDKESFDIKVKEKAEQGKANNKILEILSSEFDVPVNKIKMIKGAKQRSKIFKINE